MIEGQDRGEGRYKTHLPDICLGIVHLWNRNVGSALPHLERGVELARAQTRVAHLGEALNWLGSARLESGDAAGAEQALREGLELLEGVHVVMTPARAEALLGLGRVALAKGGTESALAHLRDADRFWAAFDPDNRGAGVAIPDSATRDRHLHPIDWCGSRFTAPCSPAQPQIRPEVHCEAALREM